MLQLQSSHYACTALSGTRALLQKPQKALVFGTDNTVQSLYLQMKLLYDAGDQPGELVHINRVDESHGFFNAVWKKRVVSVHDSIIETTQIFSFLAKYDVIFQKYPYTLTTNT